MPPEQIERISVALEEGATALLDGDIRGVLLAIAGAGGAPDGVVDVLLATLAAEWDAAFEGLVGLLTEVVLGSEPVTPTRGVRADCARVEVRIAC